MFFMIDIIDIASYAGDNTPYSVRITPYSVTWKQSYKRHQSNLLNGSMKMA